MAIQSRLLALPAELRNRIYYFAVVEDHPIDVSKTRGHIRESALLRTSQQLRNE